jgi:hypothetical protein
MATYAVVPRVDHTGYDILVKDDNGARHTILGFRTMVAAEAWIADDRLVNGSSPIQNGRRDP